jgi:hypothetical protein
MAPVSYELLNNTLGKGILGEFNSSLDILFNTPSFGIYDSIKNAIKEKIS